MFYWHTDTILLFYYTRLWMHSEHSISPIIYSSPLKKGFSLLYKESEQKCQLWWNGTVCSLHEKQAYLKKRRGSNVYKIIHAVLFHRRLFDHQIIGALTYKSCQKRIFIKCFFLTKYFSFNLFNNVLMQKNLKNKIFNDNYGCIKKLIIK